MPNYIKSEKKSIIPRLPLDGSLDLTYLCNNNCRHCWLRTSPDSAQMQDELSKQEIISIIDQARMLGCRHWNISGGEPMLRSDFSEIFKYITKNSISYSINTNGTLITPRIAQLMKRKGSKMISLYGATEDVHDNITRNPGSFEATMQGFSYLKEAGADFIVQIVPLRDNYHQFDDMVILAKSLSPVYRVGAPWLFLSAGGSLERNTEIASQRINPRDVIELDLPDVDYEEQLSKNPCTASNIDDKLLASCILQGNGFHIDPYGAISHCAFIKDPMLRYSLRQGTFQEAWEDFIPSLADRIGGGPEYQENCACCEMRSDCRWCDAYGYLENRRHGAKVEYLCQIARESRAYKEEWMHHNRRYYQLAGVTVQVSSDIAFDDKTFIPEVSQFEVAAPGEDTISIRHHFSLPDLTGRNLGEEVYRKPPWAIYRKGNSWIYLGISSDEDDGRIHAVAVFNKDHTRARIYNDGDRLFLKGAHNSLTLFPTDQILISRILADRDACLLHSSGVILNGKGLLFVGHSQAGKSTIVKMLKEKVEILCDDRNIIRRWSNDFRLYGTWFHGEVPLVSSSSAPLKAIIFLKKSDENQLTRISSRRQIVLNLASCMVKPLETCDWWEKTLDLTEIISKKVPCYTMEFDKSGKIVQKLEDLVNYPDQLVR